MQKRPSNLSNPASPSSAASAQRGHRKNVSQGPLSVQEETDDVVFSRDALELLRRPSFSETLDKVQHTHRGWLRKLASNGRRWNKRYFVVHGHYLSYFKTDNAEDKRNLMGALNLWRVESVTLDKNIIVITLAPDVSVNTNSLINRALMRKATSNRILLEAKDSLEASKWITTMKVTPFEEPSPRSLDQKSSSMDDLEMEDMEDARSQLSAKTASDEEAFKIKSIKVVVMEDRIYDFVDVSELTETTRLRIGELDPKTGQAELVVEVESVPPGEVRKGKALFEPKYDSSGVIKVSFVEGGEAQIAWERDVEASVDELIRQAMEEDNPSTLVLPLAGGMFVVTLFIIYIVLEFRFVLSTTIAAILSGSAAAMLAAPSSIVSSNKTETNSAWRYVLTTVNFVSTKRLASGGMSLTSKVTEQAAAKKKESTLLGEDVSILADEKSKIAELRKRLAIVRTTEFIQSAMRDGRWDRLHVEWKVEESPMPLETVQAMVSRKYIDHDFRLVRFLRARNLNIDKAEKLVKTSLLWRMALRPDYYIETYTPPSWIVRYGGAPLFVQTLSEPDAGTDARIKTWWLKDKQGALSMFFRAGGFDWRKVNRKMGDATALMKVGFWALEIGRKDMDTMHERSNGAVPSYITAVVDLEGFSLTQQIPLTELIPLARRFFSVLATSFPEILKRVIVVNTPFLFNGLWQAIRPFIPEEVQEKIQIHGRCDMNRHLRPYFNDDQIPAYLGGELTGETGDPFCKNRLPPVGPYLDDSGVELLKMK